MRELASVPMFSPPEIPEKDRGRSLWERFKEFHSENPHVYHSLLRYCRKLRLSGRTRYTINGIFETFRYHQALETTGDPFKLSNDFRAFYARLLMIRNPDMLCEFFKIRDSIADNHLEDLMKLELDK